MNNLVRRAAFAGILLLGACAGTSKTTDASNGDKLATMCVISHEQLDADHPSEMYHGQQVNFCCTKCQAKWDKMTDAEKQAKLDAMK